MSIERELLGRWHNGDLLPEEYMKLMKETKELLAEQPEQEPVAWMYDWNISGDEEYGDTKYDALTRAESITKNRAITNVQPLYTTPKREPLSEEEVFDIGYKAGFAIDQDESADYESEAYGFLNGDGYVDNEPYFKLVRAIEKAHGITGGGE